MAFAARLKTLSALGELRYEGALNTPQFDNLKSAVRKGGVSADTFANLDTLWRLRCDGALNEDEYSS